MAISKRKHRHNETRLRKRVGWRNINATMNELRRIAEATERADKLAQKKEKVDGVDQ